jgi:hypothetical protein
VLELCLLGGMFLQSWRDCVAAFAVFVAYVKCCSCGLLPVVARLRPGAARAGLGLRIYIAYTATATAQAQLSVSP